MFCQNDFPDKNTFYIRNKFKKDSVILYCNLVNFFTDNKENLINGYLTSLNITSIF